MRNRPELLPYGHVNYPALPARPLAWVLAWSCWVAWVGLAVGRAVLPLLLIGEPVTPKRELTIVPYTLLLMVLCILALPISAVGAVRARSRFGARAFGVWMFGFVMCIGMPAFLIYEKWDWL
ncbi:MAG: hypothetical protein KF696_07870 [Planctomycetes bacterium]|nr:hypothetical protein [Planctomycetota bacterium]MCW8135470.1 hypothetical protein [Planctomycetota bacterium]